MPTLEERVATLEATVKQFTDFFKFFTNPHTGRVGVMTMGAMGIETSWLLMQPDGEGAAFSVDTKTDRWGIAVEISEGIVRRDLPVIGIESRVLAVHPEERNVAFRSVVTNSQVANVDILVTGVGIELDPSIQDWFIGKTPKDAVKVWPKP